MEHAVALALAAWLQVAPRQRGPAAAAVVAPQLAGVAPRPAGPLPLPLAPSSAAAEAATVAGTRAPPAVQIEPVGSGSPAKHQHAGYHFRTPAELSGPAAQLSFP